MEACQSARDSLRRSGSSSQSSVVFTEEVWQLLRCDSGIRRFVPALYLFENLARTFPDLGIFKCPSTSFPGAGQGFLRLARALGDHGSSPLGRLLIEQVLGNTTHPIRPHSTRYPPQIHHRSTKAAPSRARRCLTDPCARMEVLATQSDGQDLSDQGIWADLGGLFPARMSRPRLLELTHHPEDRKPIGRWRRAGTELSPTATGSARSPASAGTEQSWRRTCLARR